MTEVSQEPVYRFSFELSEEDYSTFVHYLTTRTQKSQLVVRAVLGLLLIGQAFYAYYVLEKALTSWVVFLGAMGIWLLVFSRFNIGWASKKRAKAMIRSSRAGVITGYRTITISASGVSSESEWSSSLIKWSSFKEAKSHKGNLYILMGTGFGIMIPKSQFESETQLKEVETFIAEHIASSYNSEEIRTHLVNDQEA